MPVLYDSTPTRPAAPSKLRLVPDLQRHEIDDVRPQLGVVPQELGQGREGVGRAAGGGARYGDAAGAHRQLVATDGAGLARGVLRRTARARPTAGDGERPERRSAAGAQQPQPPDHALLGEQPTAELQRRCDGM